MADGARAEAIVYEWAIFRQDEFPRDVHRGPMAEEEARRWVAEWDDSCPPDAKALRKGMFVIGRRPVAEWELVTDAL